MKFLIIGFGSIGNRHYKVLKKTFVNPTIKIVSNHLDSKKCIELKDIKDYDPDYIVISNDTNKHYSTLKYLNNIFKNKKIYIEKPLFHKYFNNLKIKNKIVIGYNLRCHPVIEYLKNTLKNKTINNIEINCSSYLPNWRKNQNYEYGSTASKRRSGGLLYELSHEIDYAIYLFGDLKVIGYYKNKLSNLRIKNDDYFLGYFKSKKCKLISIKLDISSRLLERNIKINTDKYSLIADLINNRITHIDSDTKIKKFDTKINELYQNSHKKFIENKTSELSNYKEGVKILKLLDNIS